MSGGRHCDGCDDTLCPGLPSPDEARLAIDRSFYDLVVKERDYERVRFDGLQARVARLVEAGGALVATALAGIPISKGQIMDLKAALDGAGTSPDREGGDEVA